MFRHINAKKYHYVSVEEAQKNPDYWLLTQTMFYNQAARFIQEQWRKNHNKEFKGKPLQEILTTPPTSGNRFRFLKEPLDKKASEHAAKIKQGAWLDLDFKEPEFSRNIYKACREGLITLNETATAILLHSAINELKGQVRQYRFDEAGPFNIRSIGSIDNEQEMIFHAQINKLPENECHYFTIDFSREYELAFILKELQIVFDGIFPKLDQHFVALITNQFLKSAGENFQNKDLLMRLKQEMDQELDVQICHEIKNLLLNDYYTSYEVEKTTLYYTSEKDPKNENCVSLKAPSYLAGLSTILSRAQAFSPVTLSPHYNKNDLYSPLLCVTVFTASAFNILQIAAHGKEHVMTPFFTIGEVPIRLMKELDEQPKKFIRGAKQSRPVELAHPDVLANLTAHDNLLENFALSFHDLYYHVWMCSANKHKPFYRYLRELFATEKGFDMSKPIYKLIDMDESLVLYERLFKEDSSFSFYSFFSLLQDRAGINFWKTLDQHDHNLLLIIDMIINAETWKQYMGQYPKELFNPILCEDKKEILGDNFDYLEKFQQVFVIMEKIIEDNPLGSLKNPTMFYILSYRLQNDRFNHGTIIIRTLEEELGLNNVLVWYRNDGLYIRKSLTSLEERAIEKIDKDILVCELTQIGCTLSGVPTEEEAKPSVQKTYSP